jgi:hypothetical protein
VSYHNCLMKWISKQVIKVQPSLTWGHLRIIIARLNMKVLNQSETYSGQERLEWQTSTTWTLP